jgi:hypothetical protein
LRPFAPEQLATKLKLKLLNRSGKRGLRDPAFFRSAGEIQRPRNRQEVSDLRHLHRSNS